VPFGEAHNATADVEATTRCFFELVRKEVYSENELKQPSGYLQRFKEENPKPFEFIGLKHINLKKASEEIRKQLEAKGVIEDDKNYDITLYVLRRLLSSVCSHLHNHTQ